MKKLIALALTLVMAVAMFVPAAADDSDIILKGTPVVDGVVDAMYEGSATYTVEDVNPGFYGWGEDAGATFAVASFLWDENFIYLVVDVKDETLVNTGRRSPMDDKWQNDGVEIIFDNEYKWRLRANVDGDFDLHDTDAVPYDFSKCQFAYNVGTDGYVVEFAIPMNNIDVDFEFGFSLQVDNMANVDPSVGGYACGSGDAEMYYTCSSTAAKAPETTADTTPVTEPTPSDVPTTPKTFDAGIIAAVAAIVSAAGYAVTKKH